jgi:hypothetical protein
MGFVILGLLVFWRFAENKESLDEGMNERIRSGALCGQDRPFSDEEAEALGGKEGHLDSRLR